MTLLLSECICFSESVVLLLGAVVGAPVAVVAAGAGTVSSVGFSIVPICFGWKSVFVYEFIEVGFDRRLYVGQVPVSGQVSCATRRTSGVMPTEITVMPGPLYQLRERRRVTVPMGTVLVDLGITVGDAADNDLSGEGEVEERERMVG